LALRLAKQTAKVKRQWFGVLQGMNCLLEMLCVVLLLFGSPEKSQGFVGWCLATSLSLAWLFLDLQMVFTSEPRIIQRSQLLLSGTSGF